MGPFEAKQGGTERGSCWGSQRRRWGRAALFGEELVGMEMLDTKRESGGQELEVDSESGLAGTEVVVVSFWAEQRGKRNCHRPH